MCNARPPSTSHFFMRNGVQRGRWTLISCVNGMFPSKMICRGFEHKAWSLPSSQWCNLHALSNAPSDTSNSPSSKVPTSQDPLHNLKTIKYLGLHAWAHNLLLLNRTRDAEIHIQRHMNNTWSEMVSCFPCFAFYCFSSCLWFL